jgi:excisionase family DNA binding protein
VTPKKKRQQGEPSLTVAELAERWNVHQETVRRMIGRKDLKAFKAGSQWRIKLEVVQWMEADSTKV